MSHVKVAIITGAGQGIGAGIAKSFPGPASVSLMSRRIRSAAGPPARRHRAAGLGPRPTDLAALVEETEAAYGRIDAVVNNMGHGSGAPERHGEHEGIDRDSLDPPSPG